MTKPTEERIAAALELADAVDGYMGGDAPWAFSTRVGEAVKAYRATAPKPLRTRAEVDAEIAKLTRECVENEWAGDDDYELWESVTKLCREPTQDSGPTDTPLSPTFVRNFSQWYASSERHEAAKGAEPNRVTDHDADQGEPLEEPEACSCEESERLKDAVNEAAKLLNSIHELAKEIVMLSRRVP